jgi:hypothetical protein
METTTTAKETNMDINNINPQIFVAHYLLLNAKNAEQHKQAKIDLKNAKAGMTVFNISVLTNNKLSYTRI